MQFESEVEMTALASNVESHAELRELDFAELEQVGGGGALDTIIAILTGHAPPPPQPNDCFGH